VIHVYFKISVNLFVERFVHQALRTSILHIHAMFRNMSWDAGHICNLPGKMSRRVYAPEETDRRNAQGGEAVTFNQGAQTEEQKGTAKGGEDERTEGPIIIEAEIGGHCIHRMYVDGGSASKVLGEIIWPIGQIQWLVKIGDEEHFTLAWMNFVVVRSPSPHNRIIGRPGVRKLQAVPSTAHGMLKLPVEEGVITLKSSKMVSLECVMVFGQEGNLSVTKKTIEERVKDGCSLVRQKKRGQAADRNQEIQEEVGKLVEAGIIKEVHYHDRFSNRVMIKKHVNASKHTFGWSWLIKEHDMRHGKV
nr:reverse transcriptase domain-containing protein [Tanacetum cinerariifolium]